MCVDGQQKRIEFPFANYAHCQSYHSVSAHGNFVAFMSLLSIGCCLSEYNPQGEIRRSPVLPTSFCLPCLVLKHLRKDVSDTPAFAHARHDAMGHEFSNNGIYCQTIKSTPVHSVHMYCEERATNPFLSLKLQFNNFSPTSFCFLGSRLENLLQNNLTITK